MAVTTSSSSSSTSSSRQRRRSRQVSSSGCGGKLEGVGMWIAKGFVVAFFASMERLSCIRINTHDEETDDVYNDVMPLIPRNAKLKIINKESDSFLHD